MSAWFDRNFVDQHVRFRLPLFEWEREYVANFRCPLCNDSKKSTTKKRGYIYPDLDNDCLRFKCHNCGECSGWGMSAWLGMIDQSLQKLYNFEKFKEMGGTSKREEVWTPPKATRTASVIGTKKRDLPQQLLEVTTPLLNLPPDHFARVYAEGRKLPTWALEQMTFADDYRSVVSKLGFGDEEMLSKCPQDPRIIIPLLSETWKLIGIQGRQLVPGSNLRYATAKSDPNAPKVYGLHRINKKRTILVVEGPIDSMFLPNCVATADSNLLSFEAGGIYIPDNQYRNPQICRIVDKIIESGSKICLFPRELEAYKDINDMVLDGGFTQVELMKIIAENTISGPKAKLIWSRRRGV